MLTKLLKPAFTNMLCLLSFFFSYQSLASEQLDNPALIKQGEYLAKAADCMACHTNPAHMDKPFAGGYVLNLFVGNIISSNITPSKKYGIGNYTLADFGRALRQGIRRDGAYLYPAMPYTNYNGLTNADVKALYAYFMYGVKAVDNPTPVTKLPFPYNIRYGMLFWNWLFLKDKSANWSKLKFEEIEYGQYLTDTLGHCDACHTPRNFMLGQNNSKYLAGAYVGSWYAPNITSDVISGIGGWNHSELKDFLRNGHVTGKAQAGGGMAEAVSHSLRFLSDRDLDSMVAYLKQVKPIRNPGQSRASFSFTGNQKDVSATQIEPIRNSDPLTMANATTKDGQTLYQAACASCHGVNGQGTHDQFYPSLTNNSALGDINANNLVAAILFGIERQTNQYLVSMPAFKDELTDEQIVAISNYALQHFGDATLKIDLAQVHQIRAGGFIPALVQMTAPLKTIAIIILFVIVLSIIYFYRRRHCQMK